MKTVEVLVPPNKPPVVAAGLSDNIEDLGDRIANLALTKKDVVVLMMILSKKID